MKLTDKDSNTSDRRKPRRMLRELWHDPVWSKVIATGIIAVVSVAVAIVFSPGYSHIDLSLESLARWARRGIFLDRGELSAGVLLALAAGVAIGAKMAKRRIAGTTAAEERTARHFQVDLSTLEKADWSVLKIFGLNATPLSVNSVSTGLRKVDRPRILLAVDRLGRLEMLVGAGMSPSNEAEFELTAAGREVCHRKGWI